MRPLLAMAIIAAPAIARADAIADGQELAKKGQFEQAIVQFKVADRAERRAETACLIGLAQLRGGHAPEAEVRFAQCRARATGRDPVPDWLDAVSQQLDAELAKLAAVRIAGASDDPVTVSGWRDDPFEAQPIHLAPGHYELASGAAHAAIDVVGTSPLTATLVAPKPEPPPHRDAPEPPSRPSRYVLGAAGGLALIGVAAHLFVLAPARSTLASEVEPTGYDRDFGTYANARIAVVGVYAAAAIALGVGLYLRHGEAQIVPTVDAHGAGVTLAWRR